jgi:hypothetical protein
MMGNRTPFTKGGTHEERKHGKPNLEKKREGNNLIF